MKRHDKKYKHLLTKLDIQDEIFGRYADDETEGLAALEPGVKLDGRKLDLTKTRLKKIQQRRTT